MAFDIMTLLGLFVFVGIDVLEADGRILNPLQSLIANMIVRTMIDTKHLETVIELAFAVGATATIVDKNSLPLLDGNCIHSSFYSIFT